MVLAAGLSAGMALIGCGTPGAPQAPSLKLPDPVTDLSASRAGNQVSLTWTMPARSTDKLLLKGSIQVRVCRKEAAGPCSPAADLQLVPGTGGIFTETLPPSLAAGSPRPLTYFVELNNSRGRSAGLSNAAAVLAGQAPAPVAGLAAKVSKAGVSLRWSPDSAAAQPASSIAVRLHRKLLTPSPVKLRPGPLDPTPEPLEQSLLVEAGVPDGRALDEDIRFGQTYEYRAQRVARVTVESQMLELLGPLSAPLRVEVLDVFPPAVPTGLAAVAIPAEASAEASIDLSWQPDTESDLAGYRVYRREAGGDWQRISLAIPLIAPAFHDGKVQPGHTYHYAVTAIDQGGHESARSAEAEEPVPVP
jgi:hypothetical protein